MKYLPLLLLIGVTAAIETIYVDYRNCEYSYQVINTCSDLSVSGYNWDKFYVNATRVRIPLYRNMTIIPDRITFEYYNITTPIDNTIFCRSINYQRCSGSSLPDYERTCYSSLSDSNYYDLDYNSTYQIYDYICYYDTDINQDRYYYMYYQINYGPDTDDVPLDDDDDDDDDPPTASSGMMIKSDWGLIMIGLLISSLVIC